MKRRGKFKLITAVATLALCAGVMGVGVFAATTQSVQVATNISFTARNVNVTVKAGVVGSTQTTTGTSDYLNSASFNTTTSGTASAVEAKDKTGATGKEYVTVFSAAAADTTPTTTCDTLAIALDDNNNGSIPTGETYTITYQITNNDESNTMYVSFKAPELSSAETITAKFELPTNNVTVTGLTAYNSNGKAGYTLDAKASGTISISFKVKAAIDDTLEATALFDTENKTEFGFYNGYGYLPAATYGVTNNFADTTTLSALTATHGTAYTGTLAAKTDCLLPTEIAVVVGGTALTSGTDYTYNSSTGAISINANKVTGAVVIAKVFGVTNSVTTCSLDNVKAVQGVAYSGKLTAKEGSALPGTIIMTIGGTSYTGFTYDSTTGAISIPATDVTGAIVITTAS